MRKAWAYAQQHPDEAAAIVHARFPLVKQELLRQQLEASFRLEHTRATEGKPLGWMSPDDRNEAVKLELGAGLIKQAMPADQVMTDQYVPGNPAVARTNSEAVGGEGR